jgi:hypothetical protein
LFIFFPSSPFSLFSQPGISRRLADPDRDVVFVRQVFRGVPESHPAWSSHDERIARETLDALFELVGGIICAMANSFIVTNAAKEPTSAPAYAQRNT